MNDPIDNALRQIANLIPPTILEIGFPCTQATASISVMERIYETLLRNVLLPDCNLVAGKPKEIILKQEYHEPTERVQGNIGVGAQGTYALYRIPPQDRDNLPISSVCSIFHPYVAVNSNHSAYGYLDQGRSVLSVAQDVVNSHTGANMIPTPIPESINGDLIRLTPPMVMHIDYVTRCILCYDERLSNLNREAVEVFGKLAVVCAKRYIYNNSIVELDRIALRFGQSIGAIKEIISGYKDAETRYDELIEEFCGSALFDVKRLISVIGYQLGSY